MVAPIYAQLAVLKGLAQPGSPPPAVPRGEGYTQVEAVPVGALDRVRDAIGRSRGQVRAP